MSPQAKGAELRGWLEAAIFSADAALPFNPPGIANTSIANTGIADTDKAAEASETMVASSKTEAEISAESGSALGRTNMEVPNHKRKLATIRRILAVMAIDDEHDVLTIDGWKVVADKAEKFSRDEFVLFLEIDSFLPASSEFEEWFVDIGPTITFDGETGYRVGTSIWSDLYGNEIISQGHVFRVSDFPEIDTKVCDWHWEHIDETEEKFDDFLREIDFSDHFGVKKWESFPEIVEETLDMPAPKAEETKAPMPASNMKTSNNKTAARIPTFNPKPPSFIIKADMERVQNCPNLFTKPKYKDFIFQESVKMDGSTTTIYFVTNDSNIDMPALPTLDKTNQHTFLQYAVHPNGRLGVCTRAQDLLPHLIPSKTAPSHTIFWSTTLAAGLHEILPAVNRNLAIQAELVGATIQGNPHRYPKTPMGPAHELHVFAITEFTDRTSKRWHPRKVETFARDHGLKHVKVLGYHSIPSLARSHQDLVDRAELKGAEGLVFKNCTDERWFKVLSNRWILKKGDELHAARAARAAAQGGNKKGGKKGGGKKGKKEVVPVTQVAVQRQMSVRGWVASDEEVKIIHAVFQDLKEWIKRDDGLKKWVEEWNMGFYGTPGGVEEEEGSAVVTVQGMDGASMMEGGLTNGNAAGANSVDIDSASTNSAGISFTVTDYTGTDSTSTGSVTTSTVATSASTTSTVTNFTGTGSTCTDPVTNCAAANSAGMPVAATGTRVKQSTQTTGRVEVSEVKRNELVDWLFPAADSVSTSTVATSTVATSAGTDSTGTDSTGIDSTGTGTTDTEPVTNCAAANFAVMPVTATGARTQQSTQTAARVEASEVKRHELADWLGVEGFGL